MGNKNNRQVVTADQAHELPQLIESKNDKKQDHDKVVLQSHTHQEKKKNDEKLNKKQKKALEEQNENIKESNFDNDLIVRRIENKKYQEDSSKKTIQLDLDNFNPQSHTIIRHRKKSYDELQTHATIPICEKRAIDLKKREVKNDKKMVMTMEDIEDLNGDYNGELNHIGRTEPTRSQGQNYLRDFGKPRRARISRM